MAHPARNGQPSRHGSMPPKRQEASTLNIVASTGSTAEWQPSQTQLEHQINAAIEDIRSTLQDLQVEIKASDRYLLGLLDVIADDYRAQLPSGKA